MGKDAAVRLTCGRLWNIRAVDLVSLARCSMRVLGMDRNPPAQWVELVQRIQEGDPAAEEEVAEFFHPRVLAMASVRLRDAEAARDIAQETILAVLQAVRGCKLREAEKLLAFVFGTARNLINNYARAQSQNPRAVPLDPDTATVVPMAPVVELAERRALVRRALEHLKPLDRRILLLTLVDGMNPREIAPLVGLQPENVRTRKARAIKTISRVIANLSRK